MSNQLECMEEINELNCLTESPSKTVPNRKYLRIIRNPAHRIFYTKLRLAVHLLGIQTGKYEIIGESIPDEERKCLVCKKPYILLHFIIYFVLK